MLTVQISQLYAPQSSDTILQDIRCHFPIGWTGIIGRNGSGKTTLAKSLAGLYENYSGSIIGNDYAYYLDQQEHLDQGEFYEFLCDSTSESGVWKSKLEIDWNHLENWNNLSYGEKRRIQIALGLWKQLPVFILDEPSNHLDDYSRQIVHNALLSYSGIGILISHDRDILDGLAEQILFLDSGEVRAYSGNYSDFVDQRTTENIRARKEFEIAHHQYNTLKKEYSRRSQEANKADSKRSGAKINKNDNDARARIRLAIVSGKDGQAGRLKSQMNQRMQESQNQLAISKEKIPDKELFFKSKETESVRKNKIYFWEKGFLDLGYTRLDLPSLMIQTDTKLGIRGRNGSGKTSLLNYLYREIMEHKDPIFDWNIANSISETIYFIKQEIGLDRKSILLESIQNLPNSKKAEFLSLLHYFQFSKENLFTKKEFSPGEWKKLEIAWGILTEPQIWILDEPTNDLDIMTLNTLEE
ncbi:MAG: ABC-F family ATP-binding cassette domain-containing protein, partial [Leptospira sp.]|nr:ABC-F family ATP-binding cassette domain-containing protein [Leptospira sp.]